MSDAYTGFYGSLEWTKDVIDAVEKLKESEEKPWIQYRNTPLPSNTTAIVDGMPDGGLIVVL